MRNFSNAITMLGNRIFERILFKRQIERLYLVMGGAIFFETLAAAVEFDLFSLLDEEPGLNTNQIADRLGIHTKPARILLLGCTALGLLKKSGDSFRNSKLSQTALSRKSERNLLAVVRWQHHINYKALHWFFDALKSNKNIGLKEFEGNEPYLYGRLVHHPELEQIFQDAMQDISRQSNSQLTRFIDFSAYHRLLDVGGGNATNIIALAKKYPQLKASVFDSASVCEIARGNIANAGLADRLDAVAGDCFSDPFPDGVDCLLFCHFFTIWSEERNRMLLRKCFESLPPGGAAIIFNMMQNNAGDGPLSAAMGSPYFLTLATGEGMLYSWKEYETWMREAGFSTVKVQRLVRDHGAIIGVK